MPVASSSDQAFGWTPKSLPIASMQDLLEAWWTAGTHLVDHHRGLAAGLRSRSEETWQAFVSSAWAHHWLPEVRYLKGWSLGEVGIALLIGLLTASWYTIRKDRKHQEERQTTSNEEVSESVSSEASPTPSSPSKRSSFWADRLSSVSNLPTLEVGNALGFSTGTSWERRLQTLAMFSCSLYFAIPAAIVCWATVVHWGIVLPLHAFVLDGPQDDELGDGLLPPIWYKRRTACVAIAIWAYLWHIQTDKAPVTGGRRAWVREAKFLQTWWQRCCDYLPVVLVKTADLPATTTTVVGHTAVTTPAKYVLGYHPHGIIAVGAFCAFATDGARVLDLSNYNPNEKEDDSEDEPTKGLFGSTMGKALHPSAFNLEDSDDDDYVNVGGDGLMPSQESAPAPELRGFSAAFPNLDRTIVTLPVNFKVPFLREYTMAMGAVNSQKETFRNFLNLDQPVGGQTKTSPHTGRAMVVVVGGAAESMHAHEGHIDLVLNRRRGFVREAILANASLVPVLGFGETNLYTLYDDSEDNKKSQTSTDEKDPVSVSGAFVSVVQKFVRDTFGFAVPLFTGRSIFFKSLGVMPRRKPVVVVVGKPIAPPTWQELNPGQAAQRSTTKFQPQIDRKTDQPLNDHGRILIEWHAKYVQALEELYHGYKDAPWNSPGVHRVKSLKIIR